MRPQNGTSQDSLAQEVPAQEMLQQEPNQAEIAPKTSVDQVQSSQTQEATQPNLQPAQDLTGIDNPVMAILAAREAESAVIAEQVKLQKEAEAETEAAQPVEEEPAIEPEPELKPIENHDVRYAHEVDRWASLIERSGLMGLTRQLALQSAPEIEGNHIELTVKKDYAHLLNEKTEAELYDVVSRMAPECEFVINKSEIAEYSPASIQQNINDNRQERAEQSIQQDEFVQTLLNEFEGKVLPDSIKPL